MIVVITLVYLPKSLLLVRLNNMMMNQKVMVWGKRRKRKRMGIHLPWILVPFLVGMITIMMMARRRRRKCPKMNYWGIVK